MRPWRCPCQPASSYFRTAHHAPRIRTHVRTPTHPWQDPVPAWKPGQLLFVATSIYRWVLWAGLPMCQRAQGNHYAYTDVCMCAMFVSVPSASFPLCSLTPIHPPTLPPPLLTPDSDEYENQNEVMSIRSVSADGRTVITNEYFEYSHYG